jgi:hypothetical protein
MKMLNIIGLIGEAGSGKDTVAEYLQEDYNYEILSFTQPIIRALSSMYTVDRLIFTDRDTKDTPMDELFGQTPRRLMQTLGTDWGRDMIDPELWVKLLNDDVEYFMDLSIGAKDPIGIVIPGVRFMNEIMYLDLLDNKYDSIRTMLVRVERPDNPYRLAQEPGKHSSEDLAKLSYRELCERIADELRPYPRVRKMPIVSIINDGNLADLRNETDILIKAAWSGGE